MTIPDDKLPALLACPLCGGDKGYKLDEGSTYRWWSVRCADCGQEVSEARATYPAETTPRTPAADFAWNAAGKHAQALRDEIASLRCAYEAGKAEAVAWLPIETAPKDGTPVLIGRDMGEFGFVRGYGRFDGIEGSFLSGWISHGFNEFQGDLGLAHPTHWQPIPAPPKE